MAANDAAGVAYDAGMRSAEVFVKGPGSGREAAIRAIRWCWNQISKDQRCYSYTTQRL